VELEMRRRRNRSRRKDEERIDEVAESMFRV
jgi:hypothetical protein